MRWVDGIIYINLDDRTDRKEWIEEEFTRMKFPLEKIHRLSGVLDRLNGIRGCLLSHIQALELAQAKGWNRFLILEDDCLFVEDSITLEASLESFFIALKDDWDVLFLGGTYLEKKKTSWEGILRIHYSFCAHAYVVQRSYIEKLKKAFLYGIEMIKSHLFISHSSEYALDRVWLPLQKRDRWYGFEKHYVLQRMSRSDIDIISNPMLHFAQVIYIDRGNSQKLERELERALFFLHKAHRVSNHLEAIEKARSLKGSRYLILEDTATFPKDLDEFDFHLMHFFRWKAEDWGLLLFDKESCQSINSKHPHFLEVTKVFSPEMYVVSKMFLDPLYAHYMKGESLDTLEINPEMAVFCSPT